MSKIRIVEAHSYNRRARAHIGEFINGNEIAQSAEEGGSLIWNAPHRPDSIALSSAYDWDICQEYDEDGEPSWITLRAYKMKGQENG